MDIFDERSFDLGNSRVLHEDKIQNVYLVNYCNQQLIVKEKSINKDSSLNHYLREVYLLGAINHESIAPILGAFINTDNTKFYIVRRFFEQTLLDEIKIRRKSKTRWLPGELKRIFDQLIAGFEYIQEQGIVHCNISPRNILRDKDRNMYLIAGFDHAYNKNPRPRSQLEVYYLSPIVAKNQVKYKTYPSRLNHDPFKSDVYSLGLTFLHMACLRKLKGLENYNQVDLDIEINRRIDGIKGDEIKNLLRSMLCYAEINRPNFIKLTGGSKIKKIKTKAVLNKFVLKVRNEVAKNRQDDEYDYTCAICQNQENGYSNNFILRNKNFYHAECVDSSLKVEIKQDSFCVVKDLKTSEKALKLDVCRDCGVPTYAKKGLEQNLCLKCFRNYDISNLQGNYKLYSVFSQFCTETFFQKLCQLCYKPSEVLFRDCHFLCYLCLEKNYSLTLIRGEDITCKWGCCIPFKVIF